MKERTKGNICWGIGWFLIVASFILTIVWAILYLIVGIFNIYLANKYTGIKE